MQVQSQSRGDYRPSQFGLNQLGPSQKPCTFQNRNGIIRLWFEKSLSEIPSQRRTFNCISQWISSRAWCCTFSFIRRRNRKLCWLRRIREYFFEHWLFKFFKWNSKPHILFPSQTLFQYGIHHYIQTYINSKILMERIIAK